MDFEEKKQLEKRLRELDREIDAIEAEIKQRKINNDVLVHKGIATLEDIMKEAPSPKRGALVAEYNRILQQLKEAKLSDTTPCSRGSVTLQLFLYYIDAFPEAHNEDCYDSLNITKVKEWVSESEAVRPAPKDEFS